MTDKYIKEIFLSVIGILGTIIAAIAAPPELRLILCSLVLLVCLAAAVALFVNRLLRYRRAELPLVTEQDLSVIIDKFNLQQANVQDIEWVAEEEARVYSKNDAIPRETLLEWFAANPKGFGIIFRPDGIRVGHLNMLPLKPSTLDQLGRGIISERDIRGDCLYTPAEKKKITALHIESICLNENNSYVRSRAILDILDCAEDTVARMADIRRLNHIYAVSATRAGDSLLRRLGFRIAGQSSERTDGHDFYIADAPEVFRKIKEQFGGRSGSGNRRSRKRPDFENSTRKKSRAVT